MLALALLAAPALASGDHPTSSVPSGAYSFLATKARSIQSKNLEMGWAYIVSGGLALGVSVPGYFLSEDLFARAIYGITQTLGVAAVGYGSYLVLLDDDYTTFDQVITGAPSLSMDEKNRIAWSFLKQNAERARSTRKIRTISHSLLAGLNVLNAVTANQRELKTALYFLAGVNTLAALSSAFSLSEEEKLIESFGQRASKRAQIDFIIGPIAGLRLTF